MCWYRVNIPIEMWVPQSLLIGILLTLGILGAIVVERDAFGVQQQECKRIPPAAVRDADTERLVENMARARPLLLQTGGVELYAVRWHGPSATFYFNRKGEPRPWALLIDDGRPIPTSLTEIRALGLHATARPLASLADVVMGPERAIDLVETKYPAFNVSTVTLLRDDDCRPVWKVAGTIDEEGKVSLLLKAYVYNNGKIGLPGGPPLPYEGSMELSDLDF